ncbi:MAG: transposase, partial [Deltaproteobacteria bacterium]|nr:transposase [Deltaproteobacteria bacterium]
METRGNAGKYREGLRELVVRAARAEGFWVAVERYGVPFNTVRYWCARARKEEAQGASACAGEKGPGEEACSGAWAPAPLHAAPMPADTVGAVETADRVTVGDIAAVPVEGNGGQPTAAAEARRTWRVHSWEEVLAAVQDWEALGTAGTAKKHGVSEQTVRNWRKQVEDVLADKGEGPSAGVATGVYVPEPADAVEAGGVVAGDAVGDNLDDDNDSDDDGDEADMLPTPVDPAEWERLKSRREAVGRRYTPTQKAEAVALATEEGPAAAARESGASPHSVYRWLEETKRAAGEPVERRWEQTELEKQRDLEILHEWHKQPGLGPSQIRNQLRRRGVRTSVQTVRRVMVEGGYRPPKVKSQAHHERYE